MKARRTNSKQVREQIRKHILECVTDENDNNYNDFNDAKKRLIDEFNRVAGHEYNLKRYPNHQERFSDYLSGIPFNFEYYNYAIKEFLNSLGINPENKEYTDKKSVHLYHYLIFRELDYLN
jgi:hypothetical protein